MAQTQEEMKARLTKLRSKPENKLCLDCPAKNPNWATLTFGGFICMDCAANHRSYGVHITFVRSTVLDTWSECEVQRMENGGNGKARAFFKQHGVQDLKTKYTSLAARQYKQQLDNLCSGESNEIWTIPDDPSFFKANITPPPASPVSPNLASPFTPVTPNSFSSPTSSLSDIERKPLPSKQGTAVAISGSLGRRPPTTKKKGLGSGVQRVAHGSVKVTEGPIPEEESEKTKEVNQSTQKTYVSSSDKRKGPDFSGCGSSSNEATTSSDTIVETNERHYYSNKNGPDFSGIGSGGKTKSETGLDMADVAWTVSEKATKAKASIGEKVDKISNSIKGFLDDL